MSTSESEIQEFFRGRVVLVTGATGFLGKVLIEKLLRVTRVKLIYMLVRDKRGRSVQQRIDDYFDNMFFSKLKQEVTDYKERMVAVEGDMLAPGLGLSPKDLELLNSQVEVIFHAAATVKFNETLNRAITINVRGTREVLLLARKCCNIKAIVHISTAYANCTRLVVKEEFFEPPITGDQAIRLCECLNDQQFAAITDSICGEYPNTYTFTKGIAENIVQVYGKGLPVVVLRPAIVINTAEEPIKGWTDNVYGPTGVQVSFGAGILRAFIVNEEYMAELVPVDLVVNTTIASAWDISKTRKDDTIPVYNYVSSCQNPITWGSFISASLRHGRDSPLVSALWYYFILTTKHPPLFFLYRIMLHVFPALFIDFALRLSGRKPGLMKIYDKIHKFSSVILYFSLRKWLFDNRRVLALWDRMSERDRQLFNFDISSVHWDSFLKNSVAGIRLRFFNETNDTIPAARRKQFWLMIIHYSICAVMLYATVWILAQLYSFSVAIFTLLIPTMCSCSTFHSY